MSMKLLACILALSSLAPAEDYPVAISPFSITSEIDGTFIPTKTQALSLSPQRWKNFVIKSIPPHGSEISKEAPLITFETEGIDKQILKLTKNIATQELKLAIAQRELAELQQSNALALTEAKRALEEAEEDYAYFKATGLPAEKEAAAHTVQRTKDYLTYSEEELAQLLKMYTEDNLTEETEEIILYRQKAKVRDAKRSLANVERQTARKLDVTLPRQGIKHQTTIEEKSIAYATAKLNLERQYELTKLQVAELTETLATTKETLAETQADQELFQVIAEFDGRLFYGEFKDGGWKKEKSHEILRVGQKLPTEKTVLTLVAKDSPLSLQALVSSTKAKTLAKSLEESVADSPKANVASHPNLANKHLVTIPAKAPEAFQFPGQSHKAEIVFYQNDNAIVIPKDAVQEREDGSSYVLVKLAEGEPEERTVELGRSSKEQVEVLSGLEAGQVIRR